MAAASSQALARGYEDIRDGRYSTRAKGGAPVGEQLARARAKQSRLADAVQALVVARPQLAGQLVPALAHAGETVRLWPAEAEAA